MPIEKHRDLAKNFFTHRLAQRKGDMSTITIINTDYATLWYHADQKIVHHQFHKYIYGEEFRAVLKSGLEIFCLNGAYKWLSDDRKNSALTAEDTKWGIEVWAPKVLAAGWRYWAIVMPDKIAGKLNMQRIIDNYAARGLTIDIFDDPAEARKWLDPV